jgi:hypothetical protein
MKIAQQLAQMDLADAHEAAESKAIAQDQIWGGDGYTKYTFDDNSVLIQSGPIQYGMDADDAASIKGYADWLGKDVEFEQVEIERLMEALA